MISSFTVGSIFRIVDEASPTLRKILAEVRQLNLALDKARASLSSLGKFAMPTGLTVAVGETSALAKAWGDVAANATIAQRAIGGASAAAARTTAPAAAAAARSALPPAAAAATGTALPAAAAAALPAAAAAATGGGGGGGGAGVVGAALVASSGEAVAGCTFAVPAHRFQAAATLV